MAGMFAVFSLNLSSLLLSCGTNVPGLEICPLDVPGLLFHPKLTAPGDFYLNGGLNKNIGGEVTNIVKPCRYIFNMLCLRKDWR
ncbi:MAG: hypothetical protein JJE22_12365 [Bacteroidia bacterium]|nr:hypothetical protein [Bacteroidia bacterium]